MREQSEADCSGPLDHEHHNGFLPTGGWSYCWVGDPDRGFTKKQPGGWHYNLLPYLEQGALHDLGAGGSQPGRTQTASSPVNAFNCPTRRKAVAYPFLDGQSDCFNYNPPPTVGRSDYAGNSGQGCDYSAIPGPPVGGSGNIYSTGDGWSEAQWEGLMGSDLPSANGYDPPPNNGVTGVIFRHGVCRLLSISDGTSCTYLAGEKYLTPDFYTTGQDGGDDQGWDVGYDFDTCRWTNATEADRPKQDTGGFQSYVEFGSAHSNGFFMALCDGSVHIFNYSIDLETHRRLGNRHDGLTIDAKAW